MGLKSDHFYCLRTITHSTSGFQSTGDAIRFRTKPLSPHLSACVDSKMDEDGHPQAVEADESSDIQPYIVLVEPDSARSFLSNAAADAITNSILPQKTAGGRKQSSERSSTERRSRVLQHGEAVERSDASINQSSEKLETIRHEIDEIDRLLAREGEDFRSSQMLLGNRSNELRQELKRKEGESKEQKRKIAELEKDASNAQQKKAVQERVLREKQDARKKIMNDIGQWDREVTELQASMEKAAFNKNQHLEQIASEIQKQRDCHEEYMQESKMLEEEIHTVGLSTEELKELRRKQESEDSRPSSRNSTQIATAEIDKQWENRLSKLQMRYASAWNQLQHSKVLHGQIQQRIDLLNSTQHARSQQLAPALVADEASDSRSHVRHRRLGTTQREMNYPSINTFMGSNATPANATISDSPTKELNYSATSLTFPKSTERYNVSIGQTTEMSPDSDSFTGGAISPSAGDLLPAGLLGDDNCLSSGTDGSGHHESLERTYHPLPGLGAAIPGLGAVQPNGQSNVGPHSPSSPASGSPSNMSSPRNSSGIFYATNAHEIPNDTDRWSIRSATSSMKSSGNKTASRSSGTRFGNLFGLNRQRGKTLSNEGPAIGSLKSSESQSMPRQDVIKLNRTRITGRRGSHSVSSTKQAEDESLDTTSFVDNAINDKGEAFPKNGFTKRRTLNMFGSKSDLWSPHSLEKRSMPRPSSLGSADICLSRSSSQNDKGHIWSLNRHVPGSQVRARNLDMLSADPWQSSTSKVPAGTGSFDLDDDDDSLRPLASESVLLQPPIGTRPRPDKVTGPRLNPNAPNFKSLFSWEKKVDKRSTEDFHQVDLAVIDDKANMSQIDGWSEKSDGTGPGQGKVSQVNPNLLDTDSLSSHDLAKSDGSHEGSFNTVLTSSTQGKETLMQKISRKSSSNKFNFSNFKSKEGIFSTRARDKSPVISTDIETDDESVDRDGERALSASPVAVNVNGHRGSGISWSSIKRIGKKSEKASSVTESITSVVDTESESVCS